jgi:hypothetical protein
MLTAIDVPTLTVQDFTRQRRMIVEGWAKIIKATDESYDPSYDTNDLAERPLTCVIPPGGLPCGTDPKYISDPQARAQYTAQLQANEKHYKQATYYQQVHNLDLGAMSILNSTLDLFREVAPEGASSDYAALDAVLQQSGLSHARRQRIDAMFNATPTP